MDPLLGPAFVQDDHHHLSHSPHLPQFDISPSPGDPYNSFDYSDDNPHFPHTPSYNGSYQNSPYSNTSELPALDFSDTFIDPDNPSGISFRTEYDPGDFDQDAPLLTFDNDLNPSLGNHHVSVSVTPPMYDHSSPNAFDHGSPASSTGADDDVRSHASSASSYRHLPSPRTDLHQGFERLQFGSPHWQSNQLATDPMSPPHKPQSPPQLVIPPSPRLSSPPLINAPDGDGAMSSGPQLHIVPATPIAGGGESAQTVAFLGGPQTARQDDPSPWDSSSQGRNQPLQSSSSYTDHSSFAFGSGSNHDQPYSSESQISVPTEHHQQQQQQQQQQQHHQRPSSSASAHHFLIPQQMGQRSRSLSDTSARPPVWDTLPTGYLSSDAHQGSSTVDDNLPSLSHDGTSLGTVNMNDVLPGPASGSSGNHPNSSGLQSPPMAGSIPRVSSSAGPHQTAFSRPTPPPSSYDNTNSPQVSLRYTLGQAQSQNDFLSPDHHMGATLLRRAKSDSQGNRMLGHRQVRSEDLRHLPFNSSAFLSPHLNSTGSANNHPSAGMYPPASTASMDLIMRQSDAMSRQYLHPTETLPSISSRGGGAGHHRRSSSGSRERSLGLGAGGIAAGGWSSAASSTRASPYPSPSVSPRLGYRPLQDDMGVSVSAMGGQMDLVGGGGLFSGGPMNPGMSVPSMVGMAGGAAAAAAAAAAAMTATAAGDAMPMMVSKVNVTTPSTADASHKRRKQPANFACPVPGCGSTFTRHFNLKGHLRSHAEEKPYQCKWPGCGKGFARQHDCKRHEQLHLNIRPFPCEGCKKNFARMDALNRHLRSEGGAECRKIQEEMTASSIAEITTDLSSDGSDGMHGMGNGIMKTEPGGGGGGGDWAGGVVM